MAKIKITTRQFGELEFEDDIVLHFEDGIIGFENLKRYVILKMDDDLFFWLASVDEPEIIFPLFPAGMLQKDYPEKDKYEPFCIVRLNKEPEKITVNLKAPLYIDQENRKGYQTILDSDDFPLDYKLFIKEAK